eukprot:6200550-Pleurochrysis_carterae.AAC.1
MKVPLQDRLACHKPLAGANLHRSRYHLGQCLSQAAGTTPCPACTAGGRGGCCFAGLRRSVSQGSL